MSRLRVCIDARMETGALGGVEQVVIGLADGLSRLDGPEEYLFLTTPGKAEWLRPYLGGNCREMTVGNPPAWALRAYKLRDFLSRRLPFVRPGLTSPAVPKDLMASDGTVEWAGVDVIHFPCQMAFMTRVPSIYHPHDLQHLHLPELFPERDIELRELWYRSFCEQASMVVMMTSWGRSDLLAHYDLRAEKVEVIPWGSVMDAYPRPTGADVEAARRELELPERFLLYPAQTWRHKNHERLLEALALVREGHGEVPTLVCSGHLTEFHEMLERRVDELDLRGSVKFVGFVTPVQLRSLYELATALVFPSRFEGWGMPVSEAFASGVPVASSSATGLPEVVGDAGLIFDPDSPAEIADAVWRLLSEPELRRTLAERGAKRAAEFRLDQVAQVFRAHYRRIAGRRLSEADRALIDADRPGPPSPEPTSLESPAA